MWISGWVICMLLSFQNMVLCQNFYDSDPHIMELTPKSFERVIHQTNYTTLLEFYAPWCGYCQQLKGTMKKVAKALDGIIQVASVNCDLAKNKKLCAQHKVHGFPTLMVFRPPKFDVTKPSSEQLHLKNHANELYQGVRKLTPIVDFAISRIKNYVKRLNGLNKLGSVLQNSSRRTLLLFSKKDNVSPVYKTVALDWLGVLDCYMVPNVKLRPLAKDDRLADTHPQIFQFLQELIPAQMSSKESMLVAFDGANDSFEVFDGEAFTKFHVSKFVSDTYKLVPKEGPSSKREQYLSFLKTGKKSPGAKSNRHIVHDEL